MGSFELLLRRERDFAVGRERVPWLAIATITATGGAVYGAVMGFYGANLLQSLYSALKVPLLLTVATLICLPNFLVLNTVLGLRGDFPAAFRGILSAQGTLAICLASLAPVTALAYVSTDYYAFTKVANGAMFAVASLAGQITLAHHYGPLIASRPAHRLGLAAWLGLYMFVSVQLAWVLRPFIGAPGLPTVFFRQDAWGNAYVEVARAVWQVLTGR